MTKRLILIVLIIVLEFTANCTELILKNHDFKNGFKNWRVADFTAFSIKDVNGEKYLKVRGIINSPDKKDTNNKYLRFMQDINLTKKQIQSKKFIFGAEVKATNISGRLDIAVREINDKGSSIRYQTIMLKKNDVSPDWQKLELVFKPHSKTFKIAFFIVAYYLGTDDQILIRNIFLKEINNSKSNK